MAIFGSIRARGRRSGQRFPTHNLHGQLTAFSELLHKRSNTTFHDTNDGKDTAQEAANGGGKLEEGAARLLKGGMHGRDLVKEPHARKAAAGARGNVPQMLRHRVLVAHHFAAVQVLVDGGHYFDVVLVHPVTVFYVPNLAIQRIHNPREVIPETQLPHL